MAPDSPLQKCTKNKEVCLPIEPVLDEEQSVVAKYHHSKVPVRIADINWYQLANRNSAVPTKP